MSRDFVCVIPSSRSHHSAKFRSHRPYGNIGKGVYSIRSNSHSNCNAEVPIPTALNITLNINLTTFLFQKELLTFATFII